MKSGIIGVLLLAISIPAGAEAETPMPRGTYVKVPSARAGGGLRSHNSTIIYLNACWGGCTMTRGYPDDSVTNRSQIPNTSTAYVSEYAYGQASFDAMAACVRDLYADFGIDIVTEDPSPAPHFEAIVAGSPQEVGMSSGVGGVSPYDCSSGGGAVINNAITYTFANVFGGSVQTICEVVGQESAHAFGLDHEMRCDDPMTYLSPCGPKQFQNDDVPCGEYNNRTCNCGGSTQNSYQWIMDIFGPAQPTPPTVTITEPVDGANVQPGFIVRVDATDNVDVVRTELYLNGTRIAEVNSEPFVFNAPLDFDRGAVNVQVRAYDNRGDMGSDTIQIVLGEPCGGPDDCDDGQTCVDGRCVAGPGTDGGLGEVCTTGEDCASGLCGNDGTDQFCAEQCDPAAEGCPGGFACLDTGIGGVCWPSEGGGGCASGGGGSAAGAMLLGLLALVLFGRRRR